MQPILYDIIGVPSGATVEQINAAYRKRAFELHPDRNKEEDALEQITLLNIARATLLDEKRRLQYDVSIIDPRAGGIHAWFCPKCDIQVFVSQHGWRCNQCRMEGPLKGPRVWLGSL